METPPPAYQRYHGDVLKHKMVFNEGCDVIQENIRFPSSSGGCPPPITGEIGKAGGGEWHEVTGW